MNLKQINCALELASCLNYRRAAENLFMSQPALSYQIQSIEDEIGFLIFDRSGKGSALTPAGAQFCLSLRKIKDDLKSAIEKGKNMSSKYSEALNICIPMRSCIYFLPQIIKDFEKEMTNVALNIKFIYDESRLDLFLKGDYDILFARKNELSRFHNIKTIHIYDSHFYIIMSKTDPLAKLDIIKSSDLNGRTFMIGGGSPPEMIAVQNRIIANANVTTLNCPDHETALLNVASDKGIVMTPGFTNNHNGEFLWIPYDCPEYIDCVLGYHKDDEKESTKYFIELTQKAYENIKWMAL